jgi:hypothetical protein
MAMAEQEDDMSKAIVRPPMTDWIPQRSQRWIAAEDRADRRDAHRAAAEREARAEQALDHAIASWRSQAELSGDHVSVEQILSGGAGRTISEVLEAKRAESEAQDAYAAKFRPDGQRPDEILWEAAPAPASRAALTPLGRQMRNTLRRFTREHPSADVIERAAFAAVVRADMRRNGVR